MSTDTVARPRRPWDRMVDGEWIRIEDWDIASLSPAERQQYVVTLQDDLRHQRQLLKSATFPNPEQAALLVQCRDAISALVDSLGGGDQEQHRGNQIAYALDCLADGHVVLLLEHDAARAAWEGDDVPL